jgi:anti-sigma factor RsiW
MNEKQYSRETLRRYILGELPDSERDALSEDYFDNDALFDELLDVETELFDEYARGDMSSAERKSFEQYASGLKDRESRIATAYALARARFSSLETGSPERRPRFEHNRALRFMATAAVIIVAAALTFLFVYEKQLRRSSDQHSAEESQQAGTPRDDAAQSASSKAQPPTEAAAAGTDSSKAPQSSAGDRDALTATVVLAPALRSGGSPTSLNVSRATRFVVLDIPIEDESDGGSYRLIVQTTDGKIVFSKQNLHASKGSRYLSVRLAEDLLNGRSFKVTLQGPASGDAEISRDFYFQLVRH